MSEENTKVIRANGQDITLTLTTDYDKCRFPSWLRERSTEWFTVLHNDKHLGEVFFTGDRWKVFNASVVLPTETDLIGCLTYLYRHG